MNPFEPETRRNTYAPSRRAEPARPTFCNRYSLANGRRFMGRVAVAFSLRCSVACFVAGAFDTLM